MLPVALNVAVAGSYNSALESVRPSGQCRGPAARDEDFAILQQRRRVTRANRAHADRRTPHAGDEVVGLGRCLRGVERGDVAPFIPDDQHSSIGQHSRGVIDPRHARGAGHAPGVGSGVVQLRAGTVPPSHHEHVAIREQAGRMTVAWNVQLASRRPMNRPRKEPAVIQDVMVLARLIGAFRALRRLGSDLRDHARRDERGQRSHMECNSRGAHS